MLETQKNIAFEQLAGNRKCDFLLREIRSLMELVLQTCKGKVTGDRIYNVFGKGILPADKSDALHSATKRSSFSTSCAERSRVHSHPQKAIVDKTFRRRAHTMPMEVMLKECRILKFLLLKTKYSVF